MVKHRIRNEVQAGKEKKKWPQRTPRERRVSEITSRVTSTSGTSSRIAPAVPEIENEDFVVVSVVAGAGAPIQQLVHSHLRRSAARRNHRLQVIHVGRGAGRGVSASPGPENPSLRRNAILRQATLASVHPTGCNGRNETRTLESSLSEAEESEEFSGTERVGVGGGKGRGKTRRERKVLKDDDLRVR